MVQQNPTTEERLHLLLEGWGPAGEALACHDGRTVRVLGGIPGEHVVVEVVKRRRDYVAARVVEVLTPSPHRVAPPCPYFGPCTGCQWQHIDYEHQLEVKRQAVLDALNALAFSEGPSEAPSAPLVLPTLAAPEQYGYRNHARFTVGRRKGELGFVNRESRRFVHVRECLLMHSWINESLEQLQGRCAETSQLSLRYGVNTGDFLIQPTLKNQDIPLPSGQKHYLESVGGREFRVASPSFFQVNTKQAERMVGLVRDELQLSGKELLVDAYAGVGTFALLLAPHAGKVIAIEESTSAVHDAEVNAEGMNNVQFLRGKTEEVLAQLEERPHGVILDPPRAGCDVRTLEALASLRPQRVVYVSCDPDTLARDLKVLCRSSFRLERVQPIDMFPQTHHVECIATLSWDGPDSSASNHHALPTDAVYDGDELVLASTSPRRRDLLSRFGVGFRVVPPLVAEDMQAHESPRQMVERLALSKAHSVAKSLHGGLVLGADSVVVLDGQALGKPSDPAQAREMLKALRGRTHQVMTGVALVDAGDGRALASSQVTEVTMREYSDGEIDAYVASGEPMDKAGAYAVQDRTFHPAARWDGCYTNIMGLPLCLLADMLKEARSESGAGGRIRVPEECSSCTLRGSVIRYGYTSSPSTGED